MSFGSKLPKQRKARAIMEDELRSLDYDLAARLVIFGRT
jgi:hypothetical protein